MRQKGFSFIELLTVVAIMAAFAIYGFAGFNNYRSVQILQTSRNEVATMLNLARSRAQSQVKPSSCTNTLNGYRLVISALKNYTLYVSCSGSTNPADDIKIGQDKPLPANVSFGANNSFFFPIQGGVIFSGSNTISVTYASKTKTITVNTLGGVSLQ